MKKITFSDKYGLEQAVIAGTKTMTRRIITKFPDVGVMGNRWSYEHVNEYSPYKIGDVVAIAQRYESVYNHYKQLSESVAKEFKRQTENSFGWKNKMYIKAELMPFRIRIKDVKLEKLQDISFIDVLKEGISHKQIINTMTCGIHDAYYLPYCEAFKNMKYFYFENHAFKYLIDIISGKGTWDSNPWVFAYTFELVR